MTNRDYKYKKPTPGPVTFPPKTRNCLKCSREFTTIHNAFVCDHCQSENSKLRGRLIQKTSSGRRGKALDQNG